MICIQVFARCREQTLFCLTHAFGQLLFTGWMPEICSRSAHIMDISLKIRILRDLLCLLQQRFVTSCLYDPPLVEGQCAEAASAKTAPVADQTELDL